MMLDAQAKLDSQTLTIMNIRIQSYSAFYFCASPAAYAPILARPGKARQGQARPGKARQGQARPGKARQGQAGER
jgi:hypothetical protein